MASLNTTTEANSRRRIHNASSKRNSEDRLSAIFFAFGNEDVLKMFEAIAQHQNINTSDFDTQKKYYSRLTKLKTNSLIKKKRGKYVLTAFGASMYLALLQARKIQYLYWQLRIIDALDEKVQDVQRKEMIELLIPDLEIRKLLLQTSSTPL